MRYALALEYDGAPFCGFQTQPARCSIQDALENALAAIAGERVRVQPAGRTDAGVHATSQIVHFDADAERPLTAWVRGVNSRLPAAIAVLWCAPVPAEFHARFSARARHYTYRLLNRGERPGIEHGRVGWYPLPLAVGAMRDAAARLEGTRDFSSFRAAECQARTPVRTLTRATIVEDGACLCFEFSANGFLQHMVRNMVGALVAVGSGKRTPEWIDALVAAADRTQGAATFDAAGLYFTGADYAAAFALPPTRRAVAPSRA
ncbi:MAG: tRNA pseudouridine(38-40) synthase TruA [Proteobacteria bacterium]|jgi:tRNA pseudouridine38-40 synthase|nr:tRNA pseudouridine(38-40) synthase TruA [Pseudomonadota bacterium]